MRTFSYPTVSTILRQLKKDGLPISRPTFYKLEAKAIIPSFHRTGGKWRTYTTDQIKEIKVAVWKNYRGEEDAIAYRKKLDGDLS